MLGKKIGSLTANAVNKALPPVNGMITIETQATGSGTLADAEVNTLATYSATMQADGSFYGECHAGVIMAADGVANFRATGIGKPTADGGFSFRGMVYFQTSAPSLDSLNGIAGAYTWEVDPEGVATWEIWQFG